MWSWIIRACQVLVEDQNTESCLIEGDDFDDSFRDMRSWQVSECLNEPREKECVPVSLQAKYENDTACKNAQALCLCRQTVSSPVILCRPLLRSYRFWKETVKKHLFLNCCLSLSCFWLGRGNPSISLSLSLLPFSSNRFFFFLSWWRPLSHFQQRTILKVYQQLLVNPFLLLCACFSGVPFVLPPPQGLLKRSALSWPCGEKMAEFIPCCGGDNTRKHDTSRLRLQAVDSFLAFSLSPLLQCRH